MNPPARPALPPVAALVLCGGQGSRMGGADKGLQLFQGAPLALNALQRLRRQTLPPVAVHVSANRHLLEYGRLLGAPAWPDDVPGFAGPLAGMLTGLRRSPAPLLLTAPCDVPFFPLTLCEQLLHALLAQNAAVATAATPDAAGQLRPQPVFSLLRRELGDDLARYLQGGGRRAGQWLAAQRRVLVACATADEPLAFANANTLAELHALQAACPPRACS